MKDSMGSYLLIYRHRLGSLIIYMEMAREENVVAPPGMRRVEKIKDVFFLNLMESYETTHALHRLSVIEISYLRQRNKEIDLKMAVRKCSGWWRDNLVRSIMCSDIIELKIRMEVRMCVE